MSVEALPLFVFGTLRRGQCNHHLLDGAYLRMVPAQLPGFGKRNPLMIVRRTGDAVTGELYFIRPAGWDRTIARCDDLEGIAPGQTAGDHYRRLRVTVRTSDGDCDAWAYVSADTTEAA